MDDQNKDDMLRSPARTRRVTTKAVNYAKEQEFSDAEDLFEDESDDEVKPRRAAVVRNKPSSSRSSVGGSNREKSNSEGRGGGSQLHHLDDDDHQMDHSQRPIYTEKGYDPNLPPIRERYSFLPEYEEDGSPKIELIVGRRPIDDNEEKRPQLSRDDEEGDDDVDDDEEENTQDRRGSRRKTTTPTKAKRKGKRSDSSTKKRGGTPEGVSADEVVEYEYLVKYKGKSYLHLEWKTGADLESMNKSAKGIYRRYIKKLAAPGIDLEELETPEFDPSYVVPEKILDEADQEVTEELSDKELLKWEQQRAKELEIEGEDEETSSPMKTPEKTREPKKSEDEKNDEEVQEDWPEGMDYKSASVDHLRRILNKDGTYYATVEGCDNPYRDGYVTEPPKKPRASYLFFQATVRSFMGKLHPKLPQAELMVILGEAWRAMDDREKAPWFQLADEEVKQYQIEKVLLEKAQKPNGVWQPFRRCLQVLNRLTNDSFADIFLEPVSIHDFPDYDDIIDTRMDLGTVRKRLEARKYQGPEQFARDMRRIWNNCKIYNQHGSAIWHVADYMSKQFERLYHAWVLDFREKYIRWADPRARPWEYSCRIHDGKCGTPDDKMVLCDHCDGTYGFQCLTPPLAKVPTKAWHCPECRTKLKSTKGVRMLSAVAENAARKRAELGDVPKKTINQVMYLVKWAGLGYEFCTWETKADIGNDPLIAEFHKLNHGGFSDEADLPEEHINEFIHDAKHVTVTNAGGLGAVPLLRSQLYSQCRAIEFLKHSLALPGSICNEIGPMTVAINSCPQVAIQSDTDGNSDIKQKHSREVLECLYDIVYKVTRQQRPHPIRSNTFLPPPLSGEYDTIVPITAKGLMMNVGEIQGAVAFLGYRQFADGTKGPAELRAVVRNYGDKIIAVDGVSAVGKSFHEVINLLRESGKNKYAYMRFLEARFSACDCNLSSAGAVGGYAYQELHKKLMTDRQRVLVQRKSRRTNDSALVGEPKVKNYDGDDSEAGSEGSFEPDSEDDELVGTVGVREVSPSSKKDSDPTNVEPLQLPVVANGSVEEEKSSGAIPVDDCEIKASPDDPPPQISDSGSVVDEIFLLHREETSRSLALRLLDVDLEYSSDEAGDENCAYFVDGVDETFTTLNDLQDDISKKHKGKKSDVETQNVLPANKTEFSALGDRGKLVAAIALSTKAPIPGDYENLVDVDEKEEVDTIPDSKNLKRSTVKIEQVDLSTGECLHIWASVEIAAATLQLPLPALRQVLRGEYDEDIGEEVGGFRWRYAASGAKVTAGLSQSRGGGQKKAKEAWLEFRDKLYDPSEPHIYKNGNRLRDYQVDGVNWLASMWYKRQGCILADEMGLGKTVQIVCYIEHIFRVEKIRRPFLVVVPLSTVEHWRREFEGWTDMVCCVYHDRQRVWRDVMREYEWYYEDRPHNCDFLKFDVLVTTYDTLIGDFDVISQIPFRVAVVDEAHRLRNQKGKLLECMREISVKGTMQYGFQSRVLMSGTPLQNDLTELWTLLNFIEPFRFPDLDTFQESFGNMANKGQVEALQSMISPYMLRRVKEDVAKDIPAKEETVIDVEMTSFQKQYYRAIFEHNHAFLNFGASRNTAPKLMNIQMELRKVCNHPFLLDGVEHRETERQFKEYLDKGEFDGKTPEQQQYMLNEHGYIMTSGKMVLLDKLLPKLKQEGHKILIFSQMVKMLDLISEYCEFRDFKYERLDGRIRGSDRQKAIDRFERETDSFLFLLSTRAGGVGINLVSATICILFDSDWNPQNDVQAQARCHRIGQTKDVRVYRLVTSRSFEQEMFDRASKKLGLEQAVLGTFEKEWDDDKPTQQEMEQLLKKGAYALLDDDNDEVTKQFCADDIDSILAKRTRTRVVEGTKSASWLNKQGMVVSKSKFTSETGETLDMDDPLFWQKVMPDFVTPSILLQKLRELEDEIEGKVRGPGRGKGRWKKKIAASDADQPDATIKVSEDRATHETVRDDKNDIPDNDVKIDDDAEPIASEDEDVLSEEDEIAVKRLSQTNKRKVNKFLSDLKSMMESLFEDDDEEDALSSTEKDACQKLLLTVSVKGKIFTEEQRALAKKFLKRLEGDRRRRCRTSEQPRFQPGDTNDDPVISIREELMITGKKKIKKKRKGAEFDDELTPKKRRKSDNAGGYIGEDGYLHHSDSEDEWSDVGPDIYDSVAKKDIISRKDANRRRAWGAGDDSATAAGRAWPVFPRHLVQNVLTAVIDKVLKYDKQKGGVFSVPVPKDEFPEYYKQIKKPMDYGTMKTKLDDGEYRSAQSMQKDFVLIMQNCRTFNADSSDIVKEARAQHLLRPKFLKEAAAEHNLFLAEDGSVLEIVDENQGSPKKKGPKKKKNDEAVGASVIEEAKPKKVKITKGDKKEVVDSGDEVVRKKVKVSTPKANGNKVEGKLSKDSDVTTKKPRIQLKHRTNNEGNGKSETSNGKKERKKPLKRKRTDEEEDDIGDVDVDVATIPKKRKKRRYGSSKIDDSGDAIARNRGDGDTNGTPLFLNLKYWKQCRESLNGTFKAARKNLTQFDGWTLPEDLMDQFTVIANSTLEKMNKLDRYSVFEEKVTDREAPGYSEMVLFPMDFGTMSEKVKNGSYGNGAAAVDGFYKDFRQVFDNCYLYNDEDNEVTTEAIRVLSYLPETFVTACIDAKQRKK